MAVAHDTECGEAQRDAVATSGSEGTAAMRAVLLTGWLEVFLRSRGALLALFRELASMPPALYQRLLVVLERAVETGAGPNATAADRVAMAQAITAITDPVALVPHVPTEELREHLLAGVWRLLGEPAPTDPGHTSSNQPAPTRRSRGGRPKALSPADADRIRELHAAGKHTAESIATQLGVSRATVYRYLKTQF